MNSLTKKLLKVRRKFSQESIKQIYIFIKDIINRPKGYPKALVLIIFAYLIHRIYILANSQLSFYSDDAVYAEIARFWIQGKFDLVFHPTWPPLYPFLSALSFLFIGNWENALRLVSIISGGLILLPLFFLLKKFTSNISALLFVLIFSFLEPFIRISLFPQSDMLATLLIISALTSFIYRRFYLASFFFGLTYLTRTEGLMFFVISLPFLISKTTFKKIPLYLFIFALTISPYWLTMRVKTETLSLSQKASAQIKQGHAFQINKNGTTWSQEVVSVKSPNYKSDYFKGGLSHVLEYSDWYWFWFKQKALAWKNVLIQNLPVWSIPVIALGTSTFYLPFTLIIATTATIFATPIADIRYLFWAEITLLVFFFIGVRRLKLPGFITLVAILFFPSFNSRNIFYPQSYALNFTNTFYREEIKAAGAWLLSNSKSPEPKIMMRHEGVEFYSDGKTIYTPQGLDLDKTIKYAKTNNVDYLVAWTEEGNIVYQHNSLILVFSYPESDPKITIYEISKAGALKK